MSEAPSLQVGVPSGAAISSAVSATPLLFIGWCEGAAATAIEGGAGWGVEARGDCLESFPCINEEVKRAITDSSSDEGAEDAALRPGDEGIETIFNLSATAIKQQQKSERESSCASEPTAPRLVSRKIVMKSVLERFEREGMQWLR